MNNTLTMDECAVLSLSTYNELYDKARMLDAIVEDTIATVSFEKREPTHYDKLCRAERNTCSACIRDGPDPRPLRRTPGQPVR